ncbi:MAG: hypothetical protein ACWA5P_00425 [bacterium]
MVSTTTKVQLVEGTFTPTQASDVIIGLIEKKINFHKLQRLTMCEGDENCDTRLQDNRINELYTELRRAKEIIKEAREQGFHLEVNGTLEFNYTK